MAAFIYNNRTILIIAGIILYLVIMYFVLKKLPTKASKKIKKKEESVAKKDDDKKPSEDKKDAGELKTGKPQGEKKDKETPDLKPEHIEEKTQNTDKKTEKDDKNPKIVQIYKREQKSGAVKKEEKIDPIYDRNVEFVNVSKNVSKFKSFSDDKKEEVIDEENVETSSNDEFGFVTEKKDDCEFCQDDVKHFDHSRRLSTAVKDENFDNMFASHISDKYLNINPNKYINDSFQDSLYGRTNDMMSNSAGKVTGGTNGGVGLFESDVFNDMQDSELVGDDVQVNMKTALIADTYFNRKKKK